MEKRRSWSNTGEITVTDAGGAAVSARDRAARAESRAAARRGVNFGREGFIAAKSPIADSKQAHPERMQVSRRACRHGEGRMSRAHPPSRERSADQILQAPRLSMPSLTASAAPNVGSALL